MPKQIQKRKSSKSNKSGKSKRSNKRSSSSRSKKTRSNIRKMRGGGTTCNFNDIKVGCFGDFIEGNNKINYEVIDLNEEFIKLRISKQNEPVAEAEMTFVNFKNNFFDKSAIYQNLEQE